MWTIEEMKARGMKAFKSNYWFSVITAFILTALTAGSSFRVSSSTTEMTTESFSNLTPEQQAIIVGTVVVAVLGAVAIGIVLRIFLINPLQVGSYQFFKKNVEGTPVDLSELLCGFGDYGRVFITLLLRDLFVCLWSLLLIVPGIMKMYSYRLVPYIVKDNPELSASEILARSEQMMMGNRWQAFLLDLSFIGWFLLGIVTLGLGLVFWTNPYKYNTDAALYLKLREQA